MLHLGLRVFWYEVTHITNRNYLRDSNLAATMFCHRCIRFNSPSVESFAESKMENYMETAMASWAEAGFRDVEGQGSF